MGQLADQASVGLTCSICGIYFEKKHGHPVLCQSCKKDPANARLSIPRATHPEL